MCTRPLGGLARLDVGVMRGWGHFGGTKPTDKNAAITESSVGTATVATGAEPAGIVLCSSNKHENRPGGLHDASPDTRARSADGRRRRFNHLRLGRLRLR